MKKAVVGAVVGALMVAGHGVALAQAAKPGAAKPAAAAPKGPSPEEKAMERAVANYNKNKGGAKAASMDAKKK